MANPKAGALAEFLRGEEWLEQAFLYFGRHPDACVARGEHNVQPGADAFGSIGLARFQEHGIGGLNRQLPPFGIASPALMAKFRMTCSIWCGSTLTCHKSAVLTVMSSTSSLIVRRSSFWQVFHQIVQIHNLQFHNWRRLKARSRFVNSAARCADLKICSALLQSASFEAASARINSLYPMIAVRMLLKSWATPPAETSRPPPIFCEWTSSVSICFRLAISARNFSFADF